ncbi:hypothetical protein E4U13_002888 [Claviceps humidiphila]|uniref:Uncharacterized protein n=1 Tax=Claviceps humidiphila TaxID=1294629 RepID=A0A9P7TU87_9HYPO|nr:hypothetical protein E4U13_002888 [Claviceps humidiphila]
MSMTSHSTSPPLTVHGSADAALQNRRSMPKQQIQRFLGKMRDLSLAPSSIYQELPLELHSLERDFLEVPDHPHSTETQSQKQSCRRGRTRNRSRFEADLLQLFRPEFVGVSDQMRGGWR